MLCQPPAKDPVIEIQGLSESMHTTIGKPLQKEAAVPPLRRHVCSCCFLDDKIWVEFPLRVLDPIALGPEKEIRVCILQELLQWLTWVSKITFFKQMEENTSIALDHQTHIPKGNPYTKECYLSAV